jgi:hypothetical protein
MTSTTRRGLLRGLLGEARQVAEPRVRPASKKPARVPILCASAERLEVLAYGEGLGDGPHAGPLPGPP